MGLRSSLVSCRARENLARVAKRLKSKEYRKKILDKLPSQNAELVCSRRLGFALYVLQKLLLLSSLPTAKPYSFSHPSVDTVVNYYLSGGSYASQNNVGGVHPHIGARVRDLNRQYTEALNELDAEKKREVELDKVRRDSRN
ncbi:hypothetical protein BVC80_7575g10 [Macleaya cordata]|uniref:Uncharacterized protein n=1 Tax=Macleaya cordata TaxID=56857 RepID=A0A200QK68_MACCD|nr:hypothetical protein BVC80_7575g10 [Macleaya cordata]